MFKAVTRYRSVVPRSTTSLPSTSASCLARRPISGSRTWLADKQDGGFGEEERQAKGAEKPKDSAPYQNEYTKSGTNSEVAHNAESYSKDNTDPVKSNEKQGEALDSSPANASASRDAESHTSNKNEQDRKSASGYSQGRGSSESNVASKQDASEDKFGKISKGHDDIQTVGGRKVTQ